MFKVFYGQFNVQ